MTPSKSVSTYRVVATHISHVKGDLKLPVWLIQRTQQESQFFHDTHRSGLEERNNKSLKHALKHAKRIATCHLLLLRHLDNSRIETLILFMPKRKITKMVAGDADPPHANLLVILTDQQRFDTIRKVQEELGFPLKSRIRTPNLDRLIAQGVHFRNAYTHCPVCVCARTSFMSGRTIENTGVRGNGDEWESSDADERHSADKNGDHWKIKEIRTYDTILVEDFGFVAEYYGKCESNQYTTITCHPASSTPIS